ncbi:Uncharacterized protein TPAR_08835 [Tolypocladium paradoxum]|uniref:Transcription factor domain-containing protein n=1 Tax=Tolypocladium paradoxum TaxID=94208 RepID=A0A2S4KL55_9HYPO|nr:Uncharacterized protein TPAR_08835 [Tolypocladium paradoxum]
MKNPLVATPSEIVTDLEGRRRSLGPSSTGTLSGSTLQCRRLGLSITVPQYTARFGARVHEWSTVDGLRNVPHKHSRVPYMPDVPPIGRAELHKGLLYSAVPYHLSPTNCLWLVQYFIIMAFGKALLLRGVSESAPCGSEYFLRAMDLLPGIDGLYHDPVLSVEICCGIALYLQSVDHRNSASEPGLPPRTYGRATRARKCGPISQCMVDFIRVLDRKFCYLMCASSINDEDITISLPAAQQYLDQSHCCWDASQVVQAHRQRSIYGVDGKLHSYFFKDTQATLQELCILATTFNESPGLKIDSSSPINRASATLNVCYHQCILLATRPLLFCLLQEKLEKSCAGHRSNRDMTEPVKALLRTCHDSATKTLRVLAALRSRDLLESFLPFDLEHAFTAGCVLAILSAINGFDEQGDGWYIDTTFSVISSIICCRNMPARFRRQELERLHEMLKLVSQQGKESQAHEPESLARPQAWQMETIAQGVSPNDVLTVAHLIDSWAGTDTSQGLLDCNWLWEGDSTSLEMLSQNAGDE